ncbi:LysE family translocator [Thalassobacillus sp. CUG 92003]|uniref:LysE family translocator n=1 Tax=Thalassobacillus sp. CUG 92003 TaxID=2736641 RepID=UPI0015E72589|nr:LysE family transporter [Thalassobacillus sp. CUG 92003]
MSQLINGLILGIVASPTCPSNGEEIKQGTQSGFLAALAVGFGAVLGDALILVAVLLGLMPLIEAYPIIKSSLWLVGGLILLYISWGIFSEVSRIEGLAHFNFAAKANKGFSFLHPFWKGIAITTFNPFTIVWWIGILSPLIGADEPIYLFSSAVLVGALLWFVALAVLLHIGRRFLNKRARQGVVVVSGLIVMFYGIYFLYAFITGLS